MPAEMENGRRDGVRGGNSPRAQSPCRCVKVAHILSTIEIISIIFSSFWNSIWPD